MFSINRAGYSIVKMADWDEIKRLAADFQKVQLSSSAQKYNAINKNNIQSNIMPLYSRFLDYQNAIVSKSYHG